MKIKVDMREHDLLKHINNLIINNPKFKNIEVLTENLALGDIIILNDKEEKIIIERKSISDLAASIKDGRYAEQSYRLNGLNHPNHNIIYLIEGNINKSRFNNKTENLTLYSAIFSLNYYKGFSVIRTFSIEETAIFICNTVNKLIKGDLEGKKPYYLLPLEKVEPNLLNNNTELRLPLEKVEPNLLNNNTELRLPLEKVEPNLSLDIPYNNINLDENLNTDLVDSDEDLSLPFLKVEKVENEDLSLPLEKVDLAYVHVIKKIKKENITPENIDEIMLCQIPNISSVTAIAIIQKFKTINNLIISIKENENCLKDIIYTNSKNQIRKINKTSLTNIIKYLKK
jgi:ERCC4-type nuclease